MIPVGQPLYNINPNTVSSVVPLSTRVIFRNVMINFTGGDFSET